MFMGPFLQWLMDQRKDLSQSAIARRTRISQALVNKLLKGGTSRASDPETIRKIVEAYVIEWTEYLERHTSVAEALEKTYGWAIPQRRRTELPQDPDLAAAQEHLMVIFRHAPSKALMLQQLKAQAEFAQALLRGDDINLPTDQKAQRGSTAARGRAQARDRQRHA